MDEMFAIKAKTAAALCTHTRLNAVLSAPYSARRSVAGDAGEPRAPGLRHTPLTVVDGLLKLTHVSQTRAPGGPGLVFL